MADRSGSSLPSTRLTVRGSTITRSLRQPAWLPTSHDLWRAASCAIAFAAAAFHPCTTEAYDFHEHSLIGERSYLRACTDLLPFVDLRDHAIASRYRIACGDKEAQAAWYGQLCAVSGDHVGTPEGLSSVEGERAATRLINYTTLASLNWDHFHPRAPRVWSENHRKAMKMAVEASREVGADGLTLFDQALRRQAFGDHFLQDSFASGHMGFNRVASAAGEAHAYHRYWNTVGRWVTNRRDAAPWQTFGDGQFAAKMEGWPSERKIIEAGALSVRAFLSAFVFAQRDHALELEAYDVIPSATLLLPMGWDRGRIRDLGPVCPDRLDLRDETLQAPSPLGERDPGELAKNALAKRLANREPATQELATQELVRDYIAVRGTGGCKNLAGRSSLSSMLQPARTALTVDVAPTVAGTFSGAPDIVGGMAGVSYQPIGTPPDDDGLSRRLRIRALLGAAWSPHDGRHARPLLDLGVVFPLVASDSSLWLHELYVGELFNMNDRIISRIEYVLNISLPYLSFRLGLGPGLMWSDSGGVNIAYVASIGASGLLSVSGGGLLDGD